jgi:predicted 2-oxoglutarate/Fe(II)-dependent dioxygenase YbiX
MSLGLSICADECLDDRQFISWNTNDHFTSHQLSSKHSHSDPSRMYSDLSCRKLSNDNDDADDDDVNSMDYWDKTLRV